MTETERNPKQPKKLKSAIWKTLYTAHFLHTMGEPITSKRLAELRGKSRTTIGYHLKVLRDLGVIEPTELSEERAEKGTFGSKPIKLNPTKTTEILRESGSGGEWLDRDEKGENGLEKEISKILKELRNFILENGWTVTKKQTESPFLIKTFKYLLKNIRREDLREFFEETGFVPVGKEKDEESQIDKSSQPGRKGEIAPSDDEDDDFVEFKPKSPRHGKLGGGSRRKQKKLVRKLLEDPKRAEAEAEKSKDPEYHGLPATKRTKEFWFLFNSKVFKVYPERAKYLPKASKGEKFETHPGWKHFNKGRIQADENGAKYEEWLDCQFGYFQYHGPVGYPMPNQIHGPRAQEHWNEWEGSGSQFIPYGWTDPLFQPSEYTGKSSQVEYYDKVMTSVETVTRTINPNFPDMWAGDMISHLVFGVGWKKIAPAYLEKYHPELFAKVKKEMGETGEDS